jgi:hypothetical protein
LIPPKPALIIGAFIVTDAGGPGLFSGGLSHT